MRRSWCAGHLTVFAAVGGMCVLTGCGGSTEARGTTAARSTVPTTSVALTPVASPVASAVLDAYRAGWTAFEDALAHADPEAPGLAATMVDPQLQTVKANLLDDQLHGMVGRGNTTLHPKVTALSATSATVVDCVYSTAELVYRATGRPVPPITPPENDGVTSMLVLTGGTWKVHKQTVTDGSCAPGS